MRFGISVVVPAACAWALAVHPGQAGDVTLDSRRMLAELQAETGALFLPAAAACGLRTLVDTSISVHHLNRGELRLVALLNAGEVLCHPFVVGELAAGKLRNRDEILGLLAALPQARVADHSELLHLVAKHRLHGCGLGWADIHLLGSGLLSSCQLWTSDKALQTAARRLEIAADPPAVS